MHSTARGELSQTSTGGTRLRAQVGLSPAMVWLYRLSVIWGAAVVAGMGLTLLTDVPSIVLAWMAFAVVAIVGSMGWPTRWSR